MKKRETAGKITDKQQSIDIQQIAVKYRAECRAQTDKWQREQTDMQQTVMQIKDNRMQADRA